MTTLHDHLAAAEPRSKFADASARGGSIVEYIVGHLRSGVLQGRYAPGQRLIEADLTQDLRVSRGTAPRSVSALVGGGTSRDRAKPRRDDSPFDAARDERAVSDPRRTRSATKERFARDIKVIWDERPRAPGADYINENHHFHDAVAAASGNKQLLSLTRQLRLPALMYQLAGTLKAENIGASVSEHRAIAGAILARDPVLAEKYVRNHLTGAMDVVEAMPHQVFGRRENDEKLY